MPDCAPYRDFYFSKFGGSGASKVGHRKREATHSRNEVLAHVARATGGAATGNEHQTSRRKERKIAPLKTVNHMVVYY